MIESLSTNSSRVSQTVRPLIAVSRLAPRRERDFRVEMVRALSATIGEMDPIMCNARQLRTKHPGIAKDLDDSVEQAIELKSLLEQLRVLLLAHRTAVENDRAHREAVSRWATTFQSTR
jgi:hypothetical protein